MAKIFVDLGDFGTQEIDFEIKDIQTITIDEDYNMVLMGINNLEEYNQWELLIDLKEEIQSRLKNIADKKRIEKLKEK